MKVRFATLISICPVLALILFGTIGTGSGGQTTPKHRITPEVTPPTIPDNVPIAALASQRRIAVEHAQLVAQAQAAANARAIAAQKASATHVYVSSAPASDSSIPAAWWPTALCEEGGRDDPNYGYFGIQEWNGFGGYPRAGAAPLSVQLQWEYSIQKFPPDAPGQCHAY